MQSLIAAALVEDVAVNEELRAEELRHRRLQEHLEYVKSEVLKYRNLAKKDEEDLKAARDNVQSKEANLKLLKRQQVLFTEKLSGLEKQLKEELKNSSDKYEEHEAVVKRFEATFRRMKALEEKAKRPYGIDDLEKQVEKLKEECRMKEAAVQAYDEQLRQMRSMEKRAAQDEVNAFIIKLAETDAQRAAQDKEVQELQGQVEQLMVNVAQAKKSHAQKHDKALQASQTTAPLQLHCVAKTPQNKPSSKSLDAPTSFHFEALAVPSTSKQSVVMGSTARPEKVPQTQRSTLSMSPLLMPPPGSAVVRPRLAAGGRKLDSSRFLSDLGLLLQAAPSPKPASAQRRAASTTSGDFGTFASPCKQPRIDDGSASSIPGHKQAHQHPHVPSEKGSSSLAATVTTTSMLSHGQREADAAFVQAQATLSQYVVASATAPSDKHASAKTPQDGRPLPGSPVGRHVPVRRGQMSAAHGRQQEEVTLHGAEVSQSLAGQHGAQVSQPLAGPHSLKALSKVGPSNVAQTQPLLEPMGMSSPCLSRETHEGRLPCTSRPTCSSNDQLAAEEMDLPGPSDPAQRETVRLAMSAKWVSQQSHHTANIVQSGQQALEDTDLPVPNLAQREPPNASSMSAKWNLGFQEKQSHRTSHFAQPIAGQQQAFEGLDLPGASHAPLRQETLHQGSASSEESKEIQKTGKSVGQPPKQGHMLEPAPNTFHMEQRQAAQSPVVSPEWTTRDMQSTEQARALKSVDSQDSSKESPSQSEFSFGGAALSPEAGVEDAGYTLFGDDDDSGQEGFLSMPGTIDTGPKLTF